MFDPSFPQEGTPLEAVQMRSQLNGLKDLIDAVPPLSGAVVDGVSTVPSAQSAVVNLRLVSDVLHFTFVVPQGQDGPAGPPGDQGPPGEVTNAQHEQWHEQQQPCGE